MDSRLQSLHDTFDGLLVQADTLTHQMLQLQNALSKGSESVRPVALILHKDDTDQVKRVKDALAKLHFRNVQFKRVSGSYYKLSLEQRRATLEAPSIFHLCKSIIVENTNCTEEAVDKKYNSRYYCVVLQYAAKLEANKVMKLIRDLANSKSQKVLGKDNFTFRLCDRGEQLTGYMHNAIVPFGMKLDIPVIIAQKVVELKPAYFWLGGGEVDVKCEVRVDEFLKHMQPIVGDISDPRTSDELKAIGSVEHD